MWRHKFTISHPIWAVTQDIAVKFIGCAMMECNNFCNNKAQVLPIFVSLLFLCFKRDWRAFRRNFSEVPIIIVKLGPRTVHSVHMLLHIILCIYTYTVASLWGDWDPLLENSFHCDLSRLLKVSEISFFTCLHLCSVSFKAYSAAFQCKPWLHRLACWFPQHWPWTLV